jgi:hypothetical protein
MNRAKTTVTSRERDKLDFIKRQSEKGTRPAQCKIGALKIKSLPSVLSAPESAQVSHWPALPKSFFRQSWLFRLFIGKSAKNSVPQYR